MLMSTMIHICLACLLLTGITLIYKGFRPKPQGQAPYCRRCGYNLTGSAAQDFSEGSICPECGTPFTAANVVIGERRRRPGLIAAGGVALLISLAGLGTVALEASQPSNLFPWMPGPLLVRYIKPSDNSQAANSAWSELLQREKAGTMGTWTRQLLIDACLDAQQATVGSSWIDEQMDFLGKCYGNGQLSAAQQQRLFQQLLTLELKLRPKVYVGSKIPWTIHRPCERPRQFTIRIPSAIVKHDQDERQWSQWNLEMQGGSSSWCVLDLPPACEGRHRITIEGTLGIYYNPAMSSAAFTNGQSPHRHSCSQPTHYDERRLRRTPCRHA